MNTLYKLLAALLILCFSSCNFLDIVPDETATEDDAFKNTKAAERYLYSCYAYIPEPRSGTSSLDLLTGDDVVTPWEQEIFGQFVQGNYTPSNPYIEHWKTLFKGIRQCLLLKQNLGRVPGLDPEVAKDYQAQADFLIAYYNYLLVRTYGPTILVTELQDKDTPPENFRARTPYDECVNWIEASFKEVATRLPASRKGNEYGLATSTAAMAIRSRLLLYAASPLFNGNTEFYSDFKNPDGTPLMNLTYDPSKWVAAAEASKAAIDWADQNGCELYYATVGGLPTMPEPSDMTHRSLRFTFIDKQNTKEVIWADCRQESSGTGLQSKTLPLWKNVTWNGLAPTLAMVERFYTENGLPIDEDPKYAYNNRYNIITFPKGYPNGEGESMQLNYQREPRFYAWIAFHNGYYEVAGSSTDVRYAYHKSFKRGIDDMKSLTQFLYMQNCGTDERAKGSYSGYLNKKGAPPETSVNGSLSVAQYPWPVIRLGELYLNYAEACVETNNLSEAKIYLNKIRERAGIPSVEESWFGVAELTQDKLREIVRRERMIELYLENHNFWDLRRWKTAENLGIKPKGFNVKATKLSDFSKVVSVDFARRFDTPAHYLMPIPIGEVNKNIKLIQNPGYN